MRFGDLNGNGSHRFMYLSTGSCLVDCLGRIRRCGHVGEGVTLLEEVCHCGLTLMF